MPIEKVRMRRERSSSSPTWKSTSDARSTATRRGRPRSSPMWTMKSRAVMPIGRHMFSGMYPSIRRISRAWWGASMPSTRTRPESGVTSPSIAFMNVDFPAPFAPSRPSAGLVTDVDTSSSAVTCPNRFVTPAASISGCSEAVTPPW